MKHGFTLVELMIVVAIIGILAATAVPVYNAYIDDASRTEAHVNLADIAQKESSFFITWDRYQTTFTASAGPNAWDHTNASAYQRSIQPMAPDDQWVMLGYAYRDENAGGLFGGPVYFKYRVVTNDDNTEFMACAHRWLGQEDDEQEQIYLHSINLRAFITKAENLSDCELPTTPSPGG